MVEPIKLEVEWIFNLACPASPVHYQTDPIKTAKTNVLGILNMLELAKKNSSLLLQASTSEVYGPDCDPMDETNSNPNPNNRYGDISIVSAHIFSMKYI